MTRERSSNAAPIHQAHHEPAPEARLWRGPKPAHRALCATPGRYGLSGGTKRAGHTLLRPDPGCWPVHSRHPGFCLYVCEIGSAGGRDRCAGGSRGGLMTRPYYRPIHHEVEVFQQAYRNQLALMLKGPTGCGKSRFVEAMAADVGRLLLTVACHDDTSATDLLG